MDEQGSNAQDRQLVVTRVIAATPERIWEAWTDPEQLSKFFAPGGSSISPETVTMDVREGGEFSLTMVNDVNGEEYPMQAVYKTLDAPNKLVFETSFGLTGTIELEDLGMGENTLLTWTTRGKMENALFAGATIGTHGAADKMVAQLSGARV
jgi:uncharacterized protein YndB with AHSA1/START domain